MYVKEEYHCSASGRPLSGERRHTATTTVGRAADATHKSCRLVAEPSDSFYNHFNGSSNVGEAEWMDGRLLPI